MAKRENTTNAINKAESVFGKSISDALGVLNHVTLHRLYFMTIIIGYVLIAFNGNMESKEQWYLYVDFIFFASILAFIVRVVVVIFRYLAEYIFKEANIAAQSTSSTRRNTSAIAEIMLNSEINSTEGK